MTSPLSAERLREIINGCEGISIGPWKRVEAYAGLTLVEAPNGTLCKVPWDRSDMGTAHRDAAHIARLDPATVKAMAELALKAVEPQEPATTVEVERWMPQARCDWRDEIGHHTIAMMGRADAGEWVCFSDYVRLMAHYRTKCTFIDAKVAEWETAEAEVERLKTLNADLLMQAKGHAQEARTANSTIYEIYQVLSGGKGEPGNWNGAEPVRRYAETAEARILTLQAELARKTEALAYAAKGLDMIHNGLMDPTRPRQSVGEVCFHFLEAARASLQPSEVTS